MQFDNEAKSASQVKINNILYKKDQRTSKKGVIKHDCLCHNSTKAHHKTKLTKCLSDGLLSHPGRVPILLVISSCRDQDKHQLGGPLVLSARYDHFEEMVVSDVDLISF